MELQDTGSARKQVNDGSSSKVNNTDFVYPDSIHCFSNSIPENEDIILIADESNFNWKYQ